MRITAQTSTLNDRAPSRHQVSHRRMPGFTCLFCPSLKARKKKKTMRRFYPHPAADLATRVASAAAGRACVYDVQRATPKLEHRPLYCAPSSGEEEGHIGVIANTGTPRRELIFIVVASEGRVEVCLATTSRPVRQW